MQNILLAFLFIFATLAVASAQGISTNYKLHSHNDYLQTVPFWEAYANGMESIEADILLMDDELYVAHERESIVANRTLASLYLDPIRKAFELKLGTENTFQLLIDIKTEPYATMKKLEEVLASYEDILSAKNHPAKVQVVISGNRPQPGEYDNYPEYIQFDYQSVTEISDLPLNKIALISLNFRKYSTWDGKGAMDALELEKIKKTIAVAKTLEKPIRFWATPDTPTAWKILTELGVDFINTDQPYKARSYFIGSK